LIIYSEKLILPFDKIIFICGKIILSQHLMKKYWHEMMFYTQPETLKQCRKQHPAAKMLCRAYEEKWGHQHKL
jgi:hypothetical protein